VCLVEEREARLAELYAKIDAGMAQLDAGEGVSIEEVRADLIARFGPAQ